MNKIEKYLDSIGKGILFSKVLIVEHSGGKSFYNDGTYTLEVYQIIGSPFNIQYKSSGRKQYWLYRGDEVVGLSFNQKDFIIDMLSEIFH